MKKSICLGVVLMLIFSTIAQAYNIKIDGNVKNEEWMSVSQTELFETVEQSGNNVKRACIKQIVENEDNVIWLCFVVSYDDKKNKENSENNDIAFSIDGLKEFRFIDENKEKRERIDYTDNETISCVAQMSYDEHSCTLYCEAKVTLIHGFGEDISLKIRIYDNMEKSSIERNVVIKNPACSQTETEQETTKNTTTKKEKTAKDVDYKTTKTEETSYSRKHRNTTEYSRRTLAPKKTTVTTTEKTTKEKTTKLKTTKEKATKSKTKKETTVQVIYVMPETQETSTTVVTTRDDSLLELNDVPKSTKYKILISACFLVLLTVIGLWAVQSRKSAKAIQSEEEKETNKEDKQLGDK